MFKKAVREKVKLKMALTGVSGSGKTYSGLLIARGLVGVNGKIALIDTENRSASLYSDLTDFDTSVINAPFDIEKYTNAINVAVNAGYDCLVIDSLSHAWKQLLEDKTMVDSRGGNSFTNWAKFTPKQEAFINAITQSDIHIISTMRSKTDYVLEQNDKGKQMPSKVGLAPVQREGMEYEFTVVFDMSLNHTCEASKDRTGLFDGKIFKPSIDTGKDILTWINSGKLPAKEVDNVKLERIDKFIKFFKSECNDKFNPDLLNKFVKKYLDLDNFSLLEISHIDLISTMIKNNKNLIKEFSNE